MIKLFEKYNNIAEVKDVLLFKAIDTYDVDVIDFFMKKGYKADNNEIFEKALYSAEVLKYFLEQGITPFFPNYDTRLITQLKEEDIQRVLIDLNYAQFINDTIGFNRGLITPKEVEEVGIDGVKNFVNMKYNMNKFNL